MKKNILKIINIALVAIMVITFLVFILVLKRLNVTPFKYNVIVYIIFGIISILGILEVIFIKNKIVNIIGIILKLLVIVVTIICIQKINVANRFFNKINKVEETSIYYVVVNKDSKYKDINSLKNKNIGVLKDETSSYKKAIKKLDEKISYKKKKYDNMAILMNDLKEHKIDGILINSATKDIIDDYDDYFKDKVKVLDEISITEVIEVKKKTDDEVINVLITGVDVAGDIKTPALSDVNIIMTINPKKNEILLTSIPRDTYVRLHGTEGLKDKLTHSSIYGVDMTKATIEDFLNIKIDYYVRLNFTSLVNVVNVLGGVDVYSDQAFSEYGYYFNEGYNHLDGWQALYYARIRHVFKEGDRKRGEHQKQIIEAIIKKVSTSKEMLLNYEEFLDSLSSFFQTTIPTSLIKKYVKEQIDTMATWKIKSIAVNGTDYDAETYSIPGYNLYVLIPDQDTVDYCSSMINDMKKGKSVID